MSDTATTGSAAHVTPFGVEEPFTLVIHGASGDLTLRKLMPGLFALYSDGLLRAPFSIVGFARRDYDNDIFRGLMKEAIQAHSRVPVDDAALTSFLDRVFYHRGDLTDPQAFTTLRERLSAENGFSQTLIHYLAVKPALFESMIRTLNRTGLITPCRSEHCTRVVIEKPFGTDLASARELNAAILNELDESQIYRIDHYLGKETVQNILSFRFANSVFEPLFNNRHVDHVQITAAETVGMEGGRGGYYDTAGAIRDMVQNHILQLLCLTGMEPPGTFTAESIRNHKTEILKSIRPFTRETIAQQVVRAQYTAGAIDGESAAGYREEDRVAPDSRTASFVALKLEVDSWRWAGVPFYLRTGKRMPRRVTEIVVQFKMPPLEWFQTVECEGDVCDFTRTENNRLIFRIQPDEGISLRFSAKRPALHLVVENVDMHFSYSDKWKRSLQEAYERLLLDVMRGDPTLFNRSDEVEAAWRIVDPILQTWEDDPTLPVHEYAAGKWGPDAADELMKKDGRAWRNPDE